MSKTLTEIAQQLKSATHKTRRRSISRGRPSLMELVKVSNLSKMATIRSFSSGEGFGILIPFKFF
jgi:hypothetical protein